MKKSLLCLTIILAMILCISVPVFSAKMITTELITEINDIQYGNGVFPTEGAYSQYKGWATNYAPDAYGNNWITQKSDGTLVFNSSGIGKNKNASLQHLIDSSALSKDDKIILSFDVVFKDLNNADKVYFSISLNGDEAIPFSYEAYDGYPIICASKKGAWAFSADKAIYPLKSMINDYSLKHNFRFEYMWNESAGKYDLVYKSSPNVGWTNLSGSIPATAFTGTTLASLPESVELDLTCISDTTPSAGDVVEISNFSLTSERKVYEYDKMFFSDASYTEPINLFSETVSDRTYSFVKNDSGLDQYAQITDADVLAGAKWHTNDNGSASEKTFIPEGGWMMVRPFQQANNQNYAYVQYNRACPKLVKCFTPITDGSEFVVKSSVLPLKTSLPKDLGGGVISDMPIGFNVQLRLTNDEWNGQGNRNGDSSSVFNIFSYGINQEERSLAAVAGINQTAVNVGAVIDENSNFAAKTSLSYDIPLHGKEIYVEAGFVPSGDNYLVTVTCTDTKGNVLLKNAQPVVIGKDVVADFNRFQISATFDNCVEMTEAQSVIRYFGVKDVSIYKVDSLSGLKSGDNTVYIPYKNVGDSFNAVAVAAVYDKDNNLVSADYRLLENITDKEGNIVFDVSISDVKNQYARYYVMDNFDNLTPLKQNQNILNPAE